MDLVQISLISTIFLAIVFYIVTTHFSGILKRDNYVSFADGFILSFFILQLLPMLFFSCEKIYMNNIFFVYFWGFIIFHIVEKYVSYFSKESWKTEEHKNKLKVFIFLFQLFSFGFLVVFTTKLFADTALFILILIIMFVSVTSKSFKINELFEKSVIHFKYKKFVTVFLFLGGLIAYAINLNHFASFLIYSFCFGILLYISIRDSMDQERRVNPIYFLTGNIIAIFFIFLMNAVGVFILI